MVCTLQNENWVIPLDIILSKTNMYLCLKYIYDLTTAETSTVTYRKQCFSSSGDKIMIL